MLYNHIKTRLNTIIDNVNDLNITTDWNILMKVFQMVLESAHYQSYRSMDTMVLYLTQGNLTLFRKYLLEFIDWEVSQNRSGVPIQINSGRILIDNTIFIDEDYLSGILKLQKISKEIQQAIELRNASYETITESTYLEVALVDHHEVRFIIDDERESGVRFINIKIDDLTEIYQSISN